MNKKFDFILDRIYKFSDDAEGKTILFKKASLNEIRFYCIEDVEHISHYSMINMFEGKFVKRLCEPTLMVEIYDEDSKTLGFCDDDLKAEICFQKLLKEFEDQNSNTFTIRL